MKVTVITHLNVRVGAPSVNAPCHQFLSPGAELEVDGKLYKGDNFEGIDTWLKDESENYYWSGGVQKNLSFVVQENEVSFPNWMLELKIPQIWTHATGKNVGVAVLDTGINLRSKDLPFNNTDFFIFDNTFSLHDKHGHGTHCAGLIGARNKNGQIVGVAKDCNIYVCKISETGSFNDSETVRYADAITWCANQKDIQVISISWGSFIDTSEIILNIQKAINFAIEKNKIVVCAMGDASHFNDPGPLYPVSLENTIGIGSIPVENILMPYINKSFTTSIAGVDIPSYDLNDNIIKMTGTSQCNAIIAGIIALIIEKENFNYNHSTIKKKLSDLSVVQNFNGIDLPVLNGDLLLSYFES
jgi:subtilisin family serine protease